MRLQEVQLTEYILGKFSDSDQKYVENGKTEVSSEECSLSVNIWYDSEWYSAIKIL